jgi:hypothetical protein
MMAFADRVLVKDCEDRAILHDDLVATSGLTERAINITCYIHWLKLLRFRGQVYTFHKKCIKGSVRQQVPDPETSVRRGPWPLNRKTGRLHKAARTACTISINYTCTSHLFPRKNERNL